MNSATATATMARPTAQVLDFNAAALAAYKRRQAAGKRRSARAVFPEGCAPA